MSSISTSTSELSDTAYDILKVLGSISKMQKWQINQNCQKFGIQSKKTEKDICIYLKKHWKKKFMDKFLAIA